jgi:hypothetical protein
MAQMVDHLPSKCKALNSTPQHHYQNQTKTKGMTILSVHLKTFTKGFNEKGVISIVR